MVAVDLVVDFAIEVVEVVSASGAWALGGDNRLGQYVEVGAAGAQKHRGLILP